MRPAELLASLLCGLAPTVTACRAPAEDRAPVPYLAEALPWVHPAAAPAPALTATRATKLCQLIGDVDLSRATRVANLSERRFGVLGTDLGISVERDGEIVFLFGDTWNRGDLVRTFGTDAFATVPVGAKAMDACHDLTFAADPRDGGFAGITLDGHVLPTFEVPTGAYATAKHLWAFFTVADAAGHTIGDRGGRGVLARSSGDEHFVTVRDVSTTGERFNMVSAAMLGGHTYAELPGDWAARDVVLAYGTGHYRESFPRLALAQANHPSEPWLYFAGWSEDGTPDFSVLEQSAMPLFPDREAQACVGEMSVAWAPDVAQWLMTYNCRGKILLRAAPRPWGPWSQSLVLFDRKGAESAGVMHRPCAHFAAPCDDGDVSDRFGPDVAGDPYAPYMVPRLFSAGAAGEERIVFTMSTWNPYTTSLMEATVRVK